MDGVFNNIIHRSSIDNNVLLHLMHNNNDNNNNDNINILPHQG
jgi:hypothetical protein